MGGCLLGERGRLKKGVNNKIVDKKKAMKDEKSLLLTKLIVCQCMSISTDSKLDIRSTPRGGRPGHERHVGGVHVGRPCGAVRGHDDPSELREAALLPVQRQPGPSEDVEDQREAQRVRGHHQR